MYSTKREPAELCSSTSTYNAAVQTEAGLLKLSIVTTSLLSNVEIVPSLMETVLAVIWQVVTETDVSTLPVLTVFYKMIRQKINTYSCTFSSISRWCE